MKTIKLAIIILMTTFFIIILGTKVHATTGTINDDTVDLVKEPDSKVVLDYLYKDNEVEILEYEDGWYKVKAETSLGKVTGYVDESYIDTEESNTNEVITETTETTQETDEDETNPTVSTEIEQNTENNISSNIEEEKQYVLAQAVKIKAIPIVNAKDKSEISGNITVLEIINDWVRIENESQNGWIRKNVLKGVLTTQQDIQEETTEQQTIETEATATELNKIGYVSAEGLRVRSEPTTDSEEITSLSKNDQVKIIEQVDNWYKIDMNGEIGYVSSKYISDTKQPEVTSRSGSTLKKTSTTSKKEEVIENENQSTEENIKTEESTVDTTGEEIVEYAKQYLGYKYVSGGVSPSTGFDCSGFTLYVYNNFGISLNRTASGQMNNGIAIDRDNLQLGDLVIFNNDSNTSIGHVGIYIGNGDFIHASNPSDGVKITALSTGYYEKRYVGARRVI